jgi:hypothetical protein
MEILNNLVGKIYAEAEYIGPVVGGDGSVSWNLPKDPTKFSDIGSIINKLLPYVYVIAGLILLLMLIAGGIGLMTSAGNPDKSKAAQGRITGALIGFVIIFVSYFVAKIVEVIFGVSFM